jgi:hypothetical protein
VLEYIEADCIKTFDTARVEAQAAEAYFVDGSLGSQEDLLCAPENVEIAPEDVLQVYRGQAFYQAEPAAFSAIPGLSGVDQRAVERVNWVELPLEVCETQDFGTRIVDFSVSGGPPPALEADTEDGDGCAGILPGDDPGSDEDEGRQEGDFEVEPGTEGPEETAPLYDPPARLNGNQARNRSCGLGFELCMLLPLLLGAQRRRKARGSTA